MSKDLIEDSQIVDNFIDDDWFILDFVCDDLISIALTLQKILLFVYHIIESVIYIYDDRKINVWSIDTRILVLVENNESIFIAISYDNVCLTNSIVIQYR